MCVTLYDHTIRRPWKHSLTIFLVEDDLQLELRLAVQTRFDHAFMLVLGLGAVQKATGTACEKDTRVKG